MIVNEQKTSAFGLWRFSRDYLNAAIAVKQPAQSVQDKLKQEVSIPAYFLVGHAIELALKAFLRAKGMLVEELRSMQYGHNLDALARESRRRKLGAVVKLTRTEFNAVLLLNLSYKPKELEYIVTGARRLPDYADLVTIAQKLIQGLEGYCYKKTF